MVPFKKFKLKDNLAPNFTLTVAELKEYIDFPIKRIYFMQDFSGDTSAHCHRIEDEMFIMIKGNGTATIDQGNGIEDIVLSASDAIFVGHYIWHGFKNISPDAVILALSSTNYSPDRSDYIEDYQKYLNTRDEKLKEYSQTA